MALAFQLIVIDDKNRLRPLCRPVASNPVVDTESKLCVLVSNDSFSDVIIKTGHEKTDS